MILESSDFGFAFLFLVPNGIVIRSATDFDSVVAGFSVFSVVNWQLIRSWFLITSVTVTDRSGPSRNLGDCLYKAWLDQVAYLLQDPCFAFLCARSAEARGKTTPLDRLSLWDGEE